MTLRSVKAGQTDGTRVVVPEIVFPVTPHPVQHYYCIRLLRKFASNVQSSGCSLPSNTKT